MATEQQYDEELAPLLIGTAKKAGELGMSFVARVEWKPGESSITQIGDNSWSAGQWLACAAVHSLGNVDELCMSAIKRDGADASIFLRPHL